MKLNTVEPSSRNDRPICRYGPRGPQQARPDERVGDHERQQERRGIAHAHDLQRVHVPAEILRHGIEAGEHRHRPAHQADADQPLPAGVVAGIGQ